MPRPHEDLERHTPADHRPGGPILTFAPGTWWAIAVAHVSAERAPAGIAAYETLIEKARTSHVKAHEAGVLRSHNHRRVLALLRLDGHEAFRHLEAAWDDHHLFAERHAVSESRTLTLYRLATASGNATIEPVSTDAYAFEHLLRSQEHVRPIATPLAALTNFRGACIFGTEDDRASAIFYRFTRIEEIEAFRATSAAQNALGPVAATGDTFYQVQVIRTFA